MKYEKSCGAVVIKDKSVLLVKHNLGHWGFPKGHIENNELEKETAVREVKEETNVDIKIDLDKKYTIKYSPKHDVEKEVVFFIASPISSKLIPQESEIDTVKYIDFDTAKRTITYDEERNVLTSVLRDLSDNNLT